MSSLTEQERLGLEEVFLSISTHGNNHKRKSIYNTIKERVSQQEHKIKFSLKKLKKGIKLLQFTHLAHKKHKKKKNLS